MQAGIATKKLVVKVILIFTDFTHTISPPLTAASKVNNVALQQVHRLKTYRCGLARSLLRV
jgi:hypothetical protein